MKKVLYICLALSFASCSSSIRFSSGNETGNREIRKSNQSKGKSYLGQASYYADKFHGRTTANGERFDQRKLTAAHKTLPFGTVVEVENIKNGKKVVVVINDRGPFVRGRIIDLSKKAAEEIDMINDGVVDVKVTIIS